MQPGRHRLKTFLKKWKRTVAKASKFHCSTSSSVLRFSLQISPLAQTNNKKSHWVRKPFCWSLLSSPLMMKMAVRTSMNLKCKMWWWSILHEVQLCTTTPLSNKLHKTVKHIGAQHVFQCSAYFLYNHPVFYNYMNISSHTCFSVTHVTAFQGIYIRSVVNTFILLG